MGITIATAILFGAYVAYDLMRGSGTFMQGRLVPLYAWYRARAAHDGTQPSWAANALPSAGPARVIFLLWAAGVPLLACGLATNGRPAIALAASLLVGGVGLNAAYLLSMIRKAGQRRLEN